MKTYYVRFDNESNTIYAEKIIIVQEQYVFLCEDVPTENITLNNIINSENVVLISPIHSTKIRCVENSNRSEAYFKHGTPPKLNNGLSITEKVELEIKKLDTDGYLTDIIDGDDGEHYGICIWSDSKWIKEGFKIYSDFCKLYKLKIYLSKNPSYSYVVHPICSSRLTDRAIKDYWVSINIKDMFGEKIKSEILNILNARNKPFRGIDYVK